MPHGLRARDRLGLIKSEKTFRQSADQFLKEYEIITEGHRSKKWVEGYGIRLRLHLLPFFGDLGLSEITAGKVQEYRMHRARTPVVGSRRPPPKSKDGEVPLHKPPSRSTLHNEIVTLRQVLKTALSHGWLAHLPNLAAPYRAQTKVSHRAWFGPDEYRQLYEATRRRARSPSCAAEASRNLPTFVRISRWRGRIRSSRGWSGRTNKRPRSRVGTSIPLL